MRGAFFWAYYEALKNCEAVENNTDEVEYTPSLGVVAVLTNETLGITLYDGPAWKLPVNWSANNSTTYKLRLYQLPGYGGVVCDEFSVSMTTPGDTCSCPPQPCDQGPAYWNHTVTGAADLIAAWTHTPTGLFPFPGGSYVDEFYCSGMNYSINVQLEPLLNPTTDPPNRCIYLACDPLVFKSQIYLPEERSLGRLAPF